MSNTLRYSFFMVLLCALSACSVIPVPFTSEETQERVEQDKELINANQEPVTGAITLYEAMARALSYNLDLRLEILKKTLSTQQLKLSRYEQLPEFVSNISYDGRDEFSGASSRSLTTGLESLQSSTSSERDVVSADLSLSWNILDFGVSYFRAQQAADRILIAEEQKRTIINRILRDVRRIYWQAATNERLSHRLNSLMLRVNQAIEYSKSVEDKRLDTPLTALTYQRELINIKRQLQDLYQQLSLAKIQLASLMNLPLGKDFDLELQTKPKAHQSLGYTPQMMELLALENRSELKEAAYQKRINSKEAKAALVGLLPGINLSFGKNYNSNKFLFNTNWLSYGTQVSWNLLNIFKYPATKELTEVQSKLLDAQRLALSMAVLTQVHIGIAQYEYAKSEYITATDYNETQKKILQQFQTAVKANAVSEQELIREEMNALLAEVRYDIAYAELEGAYANSYAAMGIDPGLDELDTKDITSLANSLEQYFETQKKSNGVMSLKLDETDN